MIKLQYVDHPLIKSEEVEARVYQQVILNTATQANTLVVLPTGLGKTQVGIMLAAHRLSEIKDSKILMMAPTRPLVLQHEETFRESFDLPEEDFQVLTGKTPPTQRKEAWSSAKIFFATPQIVERDLISSRFSINDFSLLIFDEAHRAVGDYAYTFIAEKYMKSSENPLILGLTASPGGAKNRIEKIKSNLFIEETEVRSENSSDVKPYVQPVEIERRMLELPEPVAKIKNFLEKQLKDHLKTLKKCGFLDSIQKVGKRELLKVQKKIRRKMNELGPSPPRRVYTGSMAQAAAFRLSHAIELLETQGLSSFCNYLDKLKEKSKSSGSPKAVKKLVNDSRMKKVFRLAESCRGRVDNPKLDEAKKIIKNQVSDSPDSRTIVFTHYRDSATQLVESLKDVEGVKIERFVGQADRGKDKGLSQKEQEQILDKFREGKINVLVSTAVGEEGLDIPNVDLALFYEAVPSGIRSIQRRGRTGRKRPGRAVALLMKGTRDEAFYWSAIHKERRMRKALDNQSKKQDIEKNQKTLKEFEGEEMKIIVDHREASSKVVRELSRLDMDIDMQQLDVGDFILSERVGVERKTTSDFLSSMMEGRLFDQAKNLTETFDCPILVLEGSDLYSERKVHPNAIRGALASLTIDYRISIIPTKNEKMTAKLLSVIAKREQEGEEKEIPIRGGKKALTLTDQQKFIIEGLPGVSAVLAKRLLNHFATVERVVKASEEDLKEVKGIGSEKAARIKKVLTSEYKSEDQE
ncbi:MAG: DEAD/DEAH box helicase family protein [Hadesarchaea archaeon]|nr:DEAD/DEAH box helicase family protein [Hadesarchaea archaeon]